MSFDWSHYLSLAQELSGQKVPPAGQQARLRCAISCADYAAFCLARNHLRDKESRAVPSDGCAHAYVRRKFTKSPDRTRKKLGQNLGPLHKDRKKADYDDSVPNLEETTASDIMLVLIPLAKL